MRKFQTCLLILLCFSIFAGGVANAAMPCCWDMPAQSDMAGDMDMPCHKTADKSHNTVNCDCGHFLTVTAVFAAPMLPDALPNTRATPVSAAFYAPLPLAIDQPPKIRS